MDGAWHLRNVLFILGGFAAFGVAAQILLISLSPAVDISWGQLAIALSGLFLAIGLARGNRLARILATALFGLITVAGGVILVYSIISSFSPVGCALGVTALAIGAYPFWVVAFSSEVRQFLASRRAPKKGLVQDEAPGDAA
ncbi:hypothetical protein [Iodidimonas sp. SYSU 1G8]|uniref:hypothetical protein n=1 Tax=Iodidimonas sp. SYSU 1G8 TaxID=3133967 RepID=UPI0031FEBC8C